MTLVDRASKDLKEARFELPPIGNGLMTDVQLGTARYYTMKSVFRGKDGGRHRTTSLEKPAADIVKPDVKEGLDIGIARLDLGKTVQQRAPQRTQHAPPVSDFVKRRKCYLYTKGLKFNQLYSVHRNREEKLWGDVIASRSAFQRIKRSRKRVGQSKFTLPPISELSGSKQSLEGQEHKEESKTNCRTMKKDELSWEKQILSRIREKTLLVNKPGRKTDVYKKNAKSLVSSNRLRQVLDGPGVLAVSHFYSP